MSAARRPFQPVGEQARWVTIYEQLKRLGPNELLSYEDMGTLLGLDFIDDRATIHSAARRAVKELEKRDSRTCRIERGHGYRIATPEHQVALAVRHQGLAARHIRVAHAKVSIIDLNGVDPETGKLIGLMAHSLAEQGRFIRAVDVRQDRLEEAMRAVAHQADERMRTHENRTADELAAMRAELADLARQVNGATQNAAPPPPAEAPSNARTTNGFGPLFSGGNDGLR